MKYSEFNLARDVRH